MACPLCSTTACVGGWVGGYIGVHPPKHTKGRILSAVITSALITITVVALKTFFNTSLCRRGASPLENVARVGIQTLLMGILYSIGVNYLLNRFVFTPSKPAKVSPEPACCKSEKLSTPTDCSDCK